MPLIASFIATAVIGAVVHAINFDFPLSEQLVAVSVIAAGALVGLGLGARQQIWLPFAAVAGLLHGYAFGETILGSDAIVIGAYLIGVVVICAVIAVGVMLIASKVVGPADAGALPLRIAGALVAALGVFLLVQLIMSS